MLEHPVREDREDEPTRPATPEQMAPLKLSRQQILAFRRRASELDARVPADPATLRRAAWAGLQDGMPRAALLSLHARLDGIGPSTLDHPALAQLWGPRYATYVVAAEDFAVFSLGRLPEDARGRERAERTAARIHAHLGDRRETDREVGRALRIGNSLRYATTTGTIAIRWASSRRAPRVGRRPWPRRPGGGAPGARPASPCVFGPTTAERFARWAGIGKRSAIGTYASLASELVPVRTPLGDELLLAADEAASRDADDSPRGVRLLPSGDTTFLLDGAERELLLPKADERQRLWTPRVWPGALLVDGEIRGTWRRAQHTVRIETWTRLSRDAREAVGVEARSLPLPGLEREIEVVWEASAPA